LLEDVAIGKMCKLFNISQIAATSIFVESLDEVEKLVSKDFKDNFHFRTKSGNLEKRNDVELMLAIHERIHNYR